MKPLILTYFRFLFILPAIAFLGSCQIGRHYTRPDLELPETLDSLSVDTTSIGDYAWEELYTDTTLQALIRKALTYNKDMLIAAAKVKELAARKRIDISNMLPQLGLRIYAERERENYGGNNYIQDDEFELKGTVSWEIDLWGKLRWARDKSMASFLRSIENQRALKMSLIAEIAKSYFELVALDNELAIVKQTVDARKESMHLARIRYEGGLTSETAFRQAQVEYARTATLIPDLERQITLKENDIAFLTGEYPHHIQRSVLHEDVMFPVSLPVGLPSSLLERRPDVREAEQELIAANADVGIAFTSFFPSLTLYASYGGESDLIDELLKSPWHLLSANLFQPIFTWGKNHARLKAQKAALEGASRKYEKVVLNAFKEAYNAIAGFNKTKEIYETRLRLEQASKSALDLAQLQYMNGVIAYMDLLDAQRGYLEAQISLSNAIRDKQITMVNLYKALGGGWKE